MRIVADENIPYATQAFGTLGEVITLPGRAIARADLSEADALIVRSITKVREELLGGTPVRFVGTCTIGEDHIDKSWLAQAGIAFASAPGCNANSVGEYITAALLHLQEKYRLQLAGMSLGIVGVGNVGRKVLAKARTLGMRCVLNDPPLAELTGDPTYRPLEEVLDCDIVTFHVPLEKAGPWPTWHLGDEHLLRALKPGAIVLNTARGPVIDNEALVRVMHDGHLRAVVLDVWEGEPEVHAGLLEAVDIASPHIAGYSFDGKVNGTTQVYQALCNHLGVPPNWDASPLLPAPEVPLLEVDPAKPRPLLRAVSSVYDIMADDRRMRETLSLPEAERKAYFDQQRKSYPRRREFHNSRVALTKPDEALAATLRGLGFQCESRA